jgi:hypothetical protein
VIILITKENFTFKEKFRNRPNTLEFKEIMTSKNKYNLQTKPTNYSIDE